MNEIVDRVLDLLYPKKCVFCHKLTDNGSWVCSGCSTITVIPKEEQYQDLMYADGCYSAFYYENLVRESLHRYKFSHLSAYSGIYSQFISKCIGENGLSCDIITWVPISSKRKRSRGYDQSELIARELADMYGFTPQKLLKKIVNNKAQSRIGSPENRKNNVQGVYKLNTSADLTGKTIIIIDDIVTTGSTLSECCRVLKEKGDCEIICLTVARSRIVK